MGADVLILTILPRLGKPFAYPFPFQITAQDLALHKTVRRFAAEVRTLWDPEHWELRP